MATFVAEDLNNSSDYVNTVLYTGNGVAIGSGGLTVTGYDFTPSWLWMKQRDSVQSWGVYGSVIGVEETLRFNGADALVSKPEGVTAFNSSGWVCGSTDRINSSSQPYINWGFRAGTTTGISGSSTITPSSYSFNQTSGFSQIKYTGNGSAGATVLHGLGAVPGLIIIKNLDAADAWQVYHGANTTAPETDYLVLNSTAATADNINRWNDTAPTSVLFSLGDGAEVNTNTEDYIAYCYAPKQGYSKFSSFEGNGNADGAFVYTGFRPTFIMSKKTSGTDDWVLSSTIVETYNGGNAKYCVPNDSAVEADSSSTNLVDWLSNGFKARSASNQNDSGADYVYMAFAESPFVNSNGVPNNARS